VIDPGQHVPGGVQQHGARRGQPHPVPAAVQQRCADELFQPPDLLAEGRLGDEQPFRGAGEGARVGDRDEVPQVPQFKTLWRLCVRPGKPDRFRLCLLHVRHLCQAVVCLFFRACIVPGAGPRSNLPIAQYCPPRPDAVTAPRGSPDSVSEADLMASGEGLSSSCEFLVFPSFGLHRSHAGRWPRAVMGYGWCASAGCAPVCA
jgi:hypothetical protein